MNFTLHRALFVCTVVLVVGQVCAQEKLEYKFAKGKTYVFATTTSGIMTQEMMGKETKMSQGGNFVTRSVVENLTKGSIVLIVSVDSAVVTSKSAMLDTTMVMSNMIGKRMRITMSKTGEILNREVIDSVVYAGPARGTRQRENLAFLSLPAKPVSLNDTWKTTRVDTVETMGGKIINTTQYDCSFAGKVEKLGHACVKILYKGKVTVTGNMKMMGMELFMEGGGKVSGTYYFDPGKGLPVLNESTTDTETTMAATGQQQMTIPITQSAKQTTTLVREQ